MSDTEEETFEVEAVAGIKMNFRKKIVEIYVEWKGQERNQSSWEDLDGANCEVLLKPFKKGIKRLRGQVKPHDSFLDISQEEEEEPLEKDLYEVEDVVGVMWDFDYDGIMYYIKWKGWENKWNNWEPEHNVTCPVFTDFFKESADFLRNKYGEKKKAPKRVNFIDPDSKEIFKRPKSVKKAGPKSKTVHRPGPATSKKLSKRS